MFRELQCMLWCALAAVSLHSATAMAAVDFAIAQHSQTQFSLYKGDKLRLEVRLSMDGPLDTQIKWLTSGKILCRALRCEIDTARFPEGFNVVYAVLFNDRASRSIRFTFNVLQAPEGRQSYTVTPPLVADAGRGDNGPDQTTTLGALKGSVYRYSSHNLEVIRNRSTPILWNEKVRIGKKSLGWARWKNSDEHFFFNDASVFLNRFESGERFLVLETGTLRSRRLDESQNPIIILPHPQVQVTLGERSDVLVVRKADQVVLTGLRGQNFLELKNDKSRRQTLLVGSSLSIDLKTFEAKIVPHDHALLERAFVEGSPELLGLERISLLRDAMRFGEAKTEANIDDLLHKSDFILALQVLHAQKKKKGNSFDEWVALAKAYHGLGLKAQALEIVRNQEKSFQTRADGTLIAGVIAFESGDFERAADFFDDASIYYPESVILDYYKGVAHERLGERFSANYHLRDALWNSPDQNFEESVKAHLRKIDRDSWLFMSVGSGGFYKTNIVGLKSGTEGSPLQGTDSGYGTYVNYDLRLNLLNADVFTTDIKYAGFGSRYFYEEQAIANVQEHKVGVDLKLRFGHSLQEAAWLTFGVQPFAQAKMIGNKRALDSLGGEVTLASPRTPLQPLLGFESLRSIDPLPLNNDAFSPVTGYYEGRLDQTHQSSRFFLGMTWMEGDWGNLNSRFGMTTRAFEDERKHSEAFADFKYRYPLNLRLVLGSDLTYSQLQASSGDVKQDDQRIGLKLLQSVDVNPLISFDFSQAANLNQSSESERDFMRQDYTLGARLNF